MSSLQLTPRPPSARPRPGTWGQPQHQCCCKRGTVRVTTLSCRDSRARARPGPGRGWPQTKSHLHTRSPFLTPAKTVPSAVRRGGTREARGIGREEGRAPSGSPPAPAVFPHPCVGVGVGERWPGGPTQNPRNDQCGTLEKKVGVGSGGTGEGEGVSGLRGPCVSRHQGLCVCVCV